MSNVRCLVKEEDFNIFGPRAVRLPYLRIVRLTYQQTQVKILPDHEAIVEHDIDLPSILGERLVSAAKLIAERKLVNCHRFSIRLASARR